MKNQLKTVLGALAIGCLVFTAAPAAKAVPINGTITFSPPDPNTFGTINVAGGTTSVLFPAPMLVQTTVGDYNSVALLSPATFRNFSFTGTGAASTLVGAPIVGLWQVDGFSFDLTNLLTTFVPTGPGVGAFSILGNGV